MYKKRYFWIGILIMLSISVYGQSVEWTKSFGGVGVDLVEHIGELSDNELIVVGTFEGSITFGTETYTAKGGSDIFLLKLNKQGDILGSTTFGGFDTEEVDGFTISNNQIILSGFFWSDINQDTLSADSGNFGALYIAKFDFNLNLEFLNSYLGDGIKKTDDLAMDAAGNLYFSGHFGDSLTLGNYELEAAGDLDVFVMKLDTMMNILWVHQFGKTSNTHQSQLTLYDNGIWLGAEFDDSTIVSTDTLTSFASSTDIFLTKINQNGTVLLTKHITGNNQENLFDIEVEQDILYVGGHFVNVIDIEGVVKQTQSFDSDLYIARFDTLGNLMRLNQYGGGQSDNFNSLDIQNDTIAFTGYYSMSTDIGGIQLSGPSVEGFVATADELGQVIEAFNIGGSAFTFGETVYFDSKGDLYLGGYYDTDLNFGGTSFTSNGIFDFFVSKLTPLILPTIQPIDFNVAIYPNPVSTHFYIDIEESFSGELLIYNGLGQFVKSQSINNEQRISVSTRDWANGLYYVVLKNKTGSVSQQLMKLH